MEKEEGEMSDDAMEIEEDTNLETNIKKDTETKSTTIYKTLKGGLIIQELEKVDAEKLEERAKRFGLNLTGSRVVTQKQIDELYTNCGIESSNERHFRFDTLHLNGLTGLSTKEIFEYLEDYRPVSLEWIDDGSCNVVCQDHISAALALLVHSREIRSEEIKQMLSERSSYHWREGMPHPKVDYIFMRFATNGDKKAPKKRKLDVKPSNLNYDESMSSKKNPWGDLCQTWGVYDHQEVFNRKLLKDDFEDDVDDEPPKVVQIKNKKLAQRLGTRSQKVLEVSDESDSDSEWKKKSKTPRMRMHADDEDTKVKKLQREDSWSDEEQDAYAPLSIEVVNSSSIYVPRESSKLSDKFKTKPIESKQKESILSRLGAKVVPEDRDSLSDASDDTEPNVTSRIERVRDRKQAGSVWSRLSNNQVSTESSNSDLRQKLKSRKQINMQELHSQTKTKDLRDRLGKSRHENLRIEIDNK